MIKINIAIKNDKFVHIDEVKKGEKDFKCTTCNEPLIVRDGEKNTKHFSHKIECNWDNETALHKLGVQILLNNTILVLPNNKNIQYSEPKKEQLLFNSQLRSDVSAICQDGSTIHFEIFVTHEVDMNKKSLYKNNKEKSIEINLNDCLNSSYIDIKDAVLKHKNNKEFIYWPEQNNITPVKKGNRLLRIFPFLVIFLIVFILVRRLFK